jgi:3-hydroxyacyl-CoA dehydrogenase / enoyl-CoA hydratase / 3-hydroxybutyryl-CoA epimerase
MIDYKIEDEIAFVIWNMEGYPMNVLNETSVNAYAETMQKAVDDTQVKGILVTSAKDTFLAGADLKMLQDIISQPIDVQKQFEMGKAINAMLRKFEVCGKPVVTCWNGTALGGGCELGLATHYRIALKNPKAQIGLPEAQIGLIPGAGGTQRLPRMLGLEKSLPLILEGKRLSPEEAHKLGIVNELVDTPEQMIASAKKWIFANPKAMQPWDEVKKGVIIGKTNYKVPGGNIQSYEGARLIMPGTALLWDKTKGNYPAQLAIMNCVYEGLQMPIEQALVIESRYFTKVLMTPEAKNMIRTLFFALNDANKGIARPKDIPKNNLQKVGILGAGMMGAGIAYVSAMAGIHVVLKDTSVENAEKGKDYSRELLKKRASQGKITKEKAEEVLALIQTTDSVNLLAGCDLIIEAVFENRELKAKVTQETEGVLSGKTVFGSNTSTLPITGLAEASKRPENFIGIHFFSPVDKMPLVEIIRGQKTSDYALALVIDYVMKIKKTPIVVNDSRGFYTSRCFSTYSAEGIEMITEGIQPTLIENAGTMAGMPVGALDVTDAVNIDLAYKIMQQSLEAEGTTFEQAEKAGKLPAWQKLVKKMVEDLGRYGKKNKKGFYEYPENGKKYLWEGLAELYPPKAEQPDITHLKKRFLHRQAIECVRCLEEGVLNNPTDGDIGSILAWGFAPYTGGVFSYIDMIGVDTFVKELDEMTQRYGERFRPTAKLREMAEKGEKFYS